ncbi:nuclear transport factor 2 family protein [Stenotrophomonas mori]|uniref:Nuclear transport factor 2 family protein n=1 Tax=Stenotrophomonas mori TaxID=2871096 RepID=A0ABT0SEY2_9GAMM|nr:nuclear transport factor 2 family protein [Stenotrophomonas mori]MCL7713875.1 nuclear transport factor 2 family protein [Stenotrophomonas mori]
MIRSMRALAGLVLLVLALGGCARQPPEQRLRETIAQMQAAVEQGRPKVFMAAVAGDFIGNDGLDHDGLGRLLRGQLLLNARVGARTGPLTVEMGEGATATVRFTVLLTGGDGGLLPERGRLQRVVSHWRENEGRWQLYSATWSDG